MCDLPTFLCCLNYANIYCLEITCLITTISNFPLNLLGILNIKWHFIPFYCQMIYCINLAIITFSVFMIILVLISTTSKKILLTNYYKIFSQLSLMNVFLFLFLFLSFSLCSVFIFKVNLEIKSNKFDFRKFNKYEKKRIIQLIKYHNYWIILLLTTIFPILICFLNILLWISIYYRISYRIYCSFNYEIRKELRKQKKNDMQKLEEETSNEKIKDKKNIEKVELSVVFEKDRHPSYAKNIVKRLADMKTTNLKLNFENVDKYKDRLNAESSSTKRELNKSNNNN